MIRALKKALLKLCLAQQQAVYQSRRELFYDICEQLSHDRTAIARLEQRIAAFDGRHQPSHELTVVDLFRRHEGR